VQNLFWNVKSVFQNSFRKLVSITVVRTVSTIVIGTLRALRCFFFRNSLLTLGKFLIHHGQNHMTTLDHAQYGAPRSHFVESFQSWLQFLVQSHFSRGKFMNFEIHITALFNFRVLNKNVAMLIKSVIKFWKYLTNYSSESSSDLSHHARRCILYETYEASDYFRHNCQMAHMCRGVGNEPRSIHEILDNI
jgi:hypothetical protein